MFDLLEALVSAGLFWGGILGLVAALFLTWLIAQFFHTDFNVYLFVVLAIPAVMFGVFIQSRVEKENEDDWRSSN